MGRNIISKIKDISAFLASLNNQNEVENFMIEMLTKSELETLSKRWQIIEMLLKGYTQRDISKELAVSLCKVTRGSRIIKKNKSIVAQYLRSKDYNYDE